MKKEKDLEDRKINEEQNDSVSGGSEYQVKDEYGRVVHTANSRGKAEHWAVKQGFGTASVSEKPQEYRNHRWWARR